ncbi:MAG: hypothetical protein H6766_04790 [Candidatus Peribacteria bacterium]|nr:MAG: hypothetical protein H6766_04790 [Candidatus Peribacteria bacterium]
MSVGHWTVLVYGQTGVSDSVFSWANSTVGITESERSNMSRFFIRDM